MTTDLMLRRKWTFRSGGQSVVFKKNPNEKSSHVLMKAFLWGLYLPAYPDMTVEIRVGDRYKPDVVSLDDQGVPRFWGESGQVSLKKIKALTRRYPSTHFAVAKWGARLDFIVSSIEPAIHPKGRTAPMDILVFPEDSDERFIGPRGEIEVSFDDLEWRRIGGDDEQ